MYNQNIKRKISAIAAPISRGSSKYDFSRRAGSLFGRFGRSGVGFIGDIKWGQAWFAQETVVGGVPPHAIFEGHERVGLLWS